MHKVHQTPPAHTVDGYYGWVIVAVGAILIGVSFGICYSFGVFLSSLQAAFSINRATVSSIFSLYLFLVGVFSIWGGRYCDRFGPRIVVLIMGIISGLSLVLTSQVRFAWQLYFTYSVLFSLGTGAMYIIIMSTASRWISVHRAGAIGVIGAGAGLGTVLVAPFSAWLISSYQWRTAYFTMGIIAWITIIPLSLLLKKNPVEPDLEPGSQTPSDTTGALKIKTVDLPISTIMRTRQFRLLCFSWFCYSLCLYMVMGHIVPALEDLGVTPFRAAAVLSLMTIVSIPSRLVAGFMADRIEMRKVIIGFALLIAVSMVWVSLADQVWQYYLFAILFGVAYGGIDPPLVALVGDTFGLSKVGQVMGVLMISWGIGSAAGPYLGGLSFDVTGTYKMAFLAGGILVFIMAICARGLGNKRRSQHQR
jgi:MFS family permease